MKFPRDDDLFRSIPDPEYQRLKDPVSGSEDSIRTVYDRCYETVAGETLAAHKGSIASMPSQDQAAIIHKDFERIARQLDRTLEQHLQTTDGYIGSYPSSKRSYAIVDKTDHYSFDYFRWCGYDHGLLTYPLRRLEAMVDRELFQLTANKSALALFAAVVCMALLWFCQGWFFTYQGLSIVKIAALSLIFVALLALIWWSSHDPDEFASQLDLEDSPAGYLFIGVIAAVPVRLFLSGSTAALVCCVAVGLSGVCFLTRLLAARKRLRQIQSRSPVLDTLSSDDRKQFRRNVQRIYRLVRFQELWYEYKSTEENKQHMEYIRRSFMEYIEEYEQWCSKYLCGSDDTDD